MKTRSRVLNELAVNPPLETNSRCVKVAPGRAGQFVQDEVARRLVASHPRRLSSLAEVNAVNGRTTLFSYEAMTEDTAALITDVTVFYKTSDDGFRRPGRPHRGRP